MTDLPAPSSSTATLVFNQADWTYGTSYATVADVVNLTGTQSISGSKTFTSNVAVSGNNAINMGGNADLFNLDELSVNSVNVANLLSCAGNCVFGDSVNNDVVTCNANVSVGRELTVSGNLSVAKSVLGNLAISQNVVSTGNIQAGKFLSANCYYENIQTVASSANITLDHSLGSLWFVSGNLSSNSIINIINLPSTADTSKLYNASIIFNANAYCCGNIVQLSSSSSAGTAYAPKFAQGSGNISIASHGNLNVQQFTIINNQSTTKDISSIVPYF